MNHQKPLSHADAIGNWPSLKECASDMTVPVGVVEQWKARDSIPGRYWAWMALCAHRRGYAEVTLPALANAVSFKEIAA